METVLEADPLVKASRGQTTMSHRQLTLYNLNKC